MATSTRLFIVLVTVAATCLLAGCKLAVIVVEGGYVHSASNGDCLEGTICIVEVNDTSFSESFTATPNPGWYFEKWNSGDRFFCGGSTNPTCTLSFEGHEQSEDVEDMVALSETFYLMPVFKEASNVVTVDGKEWLQPLLFLNLSWADINAVCPNQTGVCTGVLKGYDMDDWTWASVDIPNGRKWDKADILKKSASPQKRHIQSYRSGDKEDLPAVFLTSR
jgi:hypothetical protein